MGETNDIININIREDKENMNINTNTNEEDGLNENAGLNEQDRENEDKEKENEDEKYNYPGGYNIVRAMIYKFKPFIQSVIGMYYGIVHLLIVVLGVFIFLFSNNLCFLSVILVIIILDCSAIVALHNCPLTLLEEKYLKISGLTVRRNILKNMGIVYQCTHEYESQLELLINMWCFVSFKMFVIIITQMFNIRINSN